MKFGWEPRPKASVSDGSSEASIFIEKPFTAQKLTEKIREILDR